MAHKTTVEWINAHLEQVGKALIAACGDQMGIDARFSGPDCRRKDAVVFRTEQTVRYRHPEPDRFGGEKTAHFRNDGVFYVRPGLWGLNAVPSRLMAFTVGVEIKEQLSDLRGDKKDMYYLGWTDFYFFLVPAELEGPAGLRQESVLRRRGSPTAAGAHGQPVRLGTPGNLLRNRKRRRGGHRLGWRSGRRRRRRRSLAERLPGSASRVRRRRRHGDRYDAMG